MKIHLISVIGADWHRDLIPHFIEYYKKLAVTDFHIILNGRKQVNIDTATKILSPIVPELWLGEYTEETKLEKILNTIQQIKNKWIVIADVDEFHDYGEPLTKLLKRCNRKGIKIIGGKFQDRTTKTGELLKVVPNVDIFEQFPIIIGDI